MDSLSTFDNGDAGLSLLDLVVLYDNLDADDIRRMSSGAGRLSIDSVWCAGLLVVRGEVKCSMGNRELHVSRHEMLITINNHAADFVQASGDLRCRLMLFSSKFLSSLRLSEKLNAYISINQSPIVYLDISGFAAINTYFDMSVGLLRQHDHPFRREALASLTEAFFYGAGYYFHLRHRRRGKTMPVILTEQFFALVRQHGFRQHSLVFYADRLCVSAKYLSSCVRRSSGTSAIRVIQNYIVQEANAMLCDGLLPLADIAHQLGFPSTADFSKYYRRVTGHSPSSIRKSSKHICTEKNASQPPA